MKFRGLILASFFLSACAHNPEPAVNHGNDPVTQESQSVSGVTFDLVSGSVVLHNNGEEKTLGQILKDGQLELASGVTGNDFALATLIMIKSQAKDNWPEIEKGLPR